MRAANEHRYSVSDINFCIKPQTRQKAKDNRNAGIQTGVG